MKTAIDNVLLALDALKKGNMIILKDHDSRENEADLIVAAEYVTENQLNIMRLNGSGIICVATTRGLLNRLKLKRLPSNVNNIDHTPFTISVDAKYGVTSGVSIKDRQTTIRTLIDDATTNQDLLTPGHVFPLAANDNGVLAREGHTEGAVDLMKLAQLKPAAVLTELMNQDGSMMQHEALNQFAAHHHCFILSIEDLIAYRKLINRDAS